MQITNFEKFLYMCGTIYGTLEHKTRKDTQLQFYGNTAIPHAQRFTDS
jgi:hypothetical protein